MLAYNTQDPPLLFFVASVPSLPHQKEGTTVFLLFGLPPGDYLCLGA